MLDFLLHNDLALIWLYMTTAFVVALAKKRNDVADVAWGLGFILIAFVSLVDRRRIDARAVIATTFVVIWGARLAYHIWHRQRRRPEDFRYRAWREAWGKWFLPRSYAQIYLLQGFLMLLVSSPIRFINRGPALPLGWLDLAGMAVWLIGFFFEAVGDWQLAQFMKDPANKGKIMDRGLWRFTRHPNYFGEVTMWWGLWLMALGVPGGGLSIIGPLLITWLILRVSGIPMLEKRYENDKAFQAYKARTSAFFPLPPKT